MVSDVDGIEVEPRPCWIAGRAEQGERIITVHHPYDGTEIADVAVPGAAQVERAVAAAHDVAASFAISSTQVRIDALHRVAELIAARAEEIAETITAENGKPLTAAAAEVTQAAATFSSAVAETTRLSGDLRRAHGTFAVARRRSLGPVLALTPFTSPLLVAAQQVAAAISVGAPIVVRPAPETPMTALLLGEILAATALPPAVFSVLPIPDLTDLVTDPRLPVVSFTGSRSGGDAVADLAPRKQVRRSVDGDTAAVVCPDWTELDRAVERIASRLPRRVIVHSAQAESFVPGLVAAVRSLRIGDPHDPHVVVGSMIDDKAAARMVAWLRSTGGDVLTGGVADGATLAPTVLAGTGTDINADGDINVDEIEGPITVVSVVDSVADAFRQASAGLVGVFTQDVATAFEAANIDADQVMIGDIPSDIGVQTAIQDFTRPQLTVFRTGLPPAGT